MPGDGFSATLDMPSFATHTRANDPGLPAPHLGLWTFPLPQTALPAVGTMRVLVAFVSFPGAPLDIPPQRWMDAHVPRTKAWFREVSSGRLNVEITQAPSTYTMPRPIADYGFDRCCDHALARQGFRDAVALADADVDFSRYDAIYLIGAEGGGMRIQLWHPHSGEAVTADGKEIRFGVVGPARFQNFFNSRPPEAATEAATHDVLTHEMGHMLGLPDIYFKPPNLPNTFERVGGWDMMSQTYPAAHLLVWNKWLLRWIDSSNLRGLTAPGEIVGNLAPTTAAGGAKGVVIPISGTQTYVVEARRKVGEDARLCDEGVLIYTVDSNSRNATGGIDIKTSRVEEVQHCGPKALAGWDAGETFEDAAVKVEVLASNADGSYRVRITRK